MKECCSKNAKPVSSWLSDKITLYYPLIVITSVSVLGAIALSLSGFSFMNAAMGLFLSFLATLKLYNLSMFAETFSKYDFLAKQFKAYGLIYPFIELALAFLYLSALFPVFTNSLMVTVMLIGTIGVVKIISSGNVLQCACVGTSFSLPVGRVTLAENCIMIAMALLNLMAIHNV